MESTPIYDIVRFSIFNVPFLQGGVGECEIYYCNYEQDFITIVEHDTAEEAIVQAKTVVKDKRVS